MVEQDVVTNKPQTSEDFATSDMRVIVTFMTQGVQFSSTETKRGFASCRTIFHYDLSNPKVVEILSKRRSGEQILVNIEDVFDAYARFHSIVHQT